MGSMPLPTVRPCLPLPPGDTWHMEPCPGQWERHQHNERWTPQQPWDAAWRLQQHRAMPGAQGEDRLLLAAPTVGRGRESCTAQTSYF